MKMILKNFIILVVLLTVINVSLQLNVKNKVHNKHQMKNKHKSKVHKQYRQRERILPSLWNSMNKKNIGNFRFKESTGIAKIGSMELNALANNDPAVEQGPIYKKGWLKFVIYNPKDPANFRNFYYNTQFMVQQKHVAEYDRTQKDDFGPIDIPDASHFFMTLTKDSLYVLAARRNELAKTQEVLALSTLYPQVEQEFSGGVEEQGNFREGFCWKVNIQAGNDKRVWILCADTLAEKQDWMQTMAKLKLRQQGFTVSRNEGNGVQEAVLTGGYGGGMHTNDDYREIGPDGKPAKRTPGFESNKNGTIDGKWVVLQSWSTCTLSCGGGTQTLQRFCVPPQNKGQPCMGKAVLTKTCNNQPCKTPTVTERGEEAETKVRMYRVSQRPQRYETCIVKEGDMELIREDMGQFSRKPRVPCRVVLNNMTLTVYQGDNYDTIKISIPLPNIKTQDYEDDNICFTAKNLQTKDTVSLCSLPSSKTELKKIRDDWIEQIEFFKTKCHEPLIQLPGPIAEIKKREVDEEIAAQKMEALNVDDTDKLQGTLAKVSGIAMDAITKEMKYERMAEQEELQREKLEEINARKGLEEMKEKEECIKRDMRRRDTAARAETNDRDMNQQITALQDNIKNMILKQRAKQSKRIAVMRKLHKARKRATSDEMNALRMKMAADMMNADKKGDWHTCDPATVEEKRNEYCNKSFAEDPNTCVECKDPQWYCYICCQNELGQFRENERKKCFDMCENGSKGRSNGGNWVWVPNGNQVKH